MQCGPEGHLDLNNNNTPSIEPYSNIQALDNIDPNDEKYTSVSEIQRIMMDGIYTNDSRKVALRSIEKLLQADPSKANERGFMFETPLHWAAEMGYEEIVTLLLEKYQVDVNAKNSLGDTPLYKACLLNNTRSRSSIIEKLLKRGADVHYIDNNGKCLLQYIIEQGKVEVAKSLLKNGLDINKKDSFGQTILHVAIKTNQIETVEFLLQNKADIYAKDNNGITALNYLVNQNSLPLIIIFLKTELQLKEIDNDLKQSPLHLAIKYYHPVLIESLLQNKADLGARDATDNTLLHYAVYFAPEQEQATLIQYLLDNGARPNMVNRNHKSPLLLAAYMGYEAVVDSLLKYGAEVKTTYPEDKINLYLAIKSGGPQIKKLLLGKLNKDQFNEYQKWKKQPCPSCKHAKESINMGEHPCQQCDELLCKTCYTKLKIINPNAACPHCNYPNY